MANFSISTKKILSASNIKRIIMLGISLKNGIESIEQDLIKEYDTTKTYSPDMACYYNDYLYRCLFTTTGEFDINSWKRVGDSLELVNKAQVETMLGLTPDELDTLANIILDSEVRLDKTWSSSKIYESVQAAIRENKTFTLQEFAKANKASYNVVSATSEMTDKSVIYLMSNNTNYDMYIVESDGTPTKIGDTKIDLSQYAKLSDLNNYYDKVTSDGKYATITTVDGKVDKTSILSSNNSSATDDQIYSAKAINTELDGVVKKTDISTTIDDTSTDDEIPTSKAINDKIEGIAVTNPNLLDNPWFTVNQRGKSSYTKTSSFYGVDRWLVCSNATLNTIETVNSDGTITITNDSGNSYILQFLREYKTEYFIGKEVTFSVMKGDSTIISHTFIYTSATSGMLDWKTEDSEITMLRWQYQNNGYFTPVVFYNSGATIKAIKLEIGKKSTLHLDIQPNYVTELIKCQRHFIKYSNLLLTTTANDKDSALIFAPITFPTNVRLSNGTIKISNCNISYIQLNGVRIDKSTITEINIYGVSNNVGYIQMRLSSKITTFPTTGLIYFENLELSSES